MVSAFERSCSGSAAPPGWPEGLLCLPLLSAHPCTEIVGGGSSRARTQQQDSYVLVCAERNRRTVRALENDAQHATCMHVSAKPVINRFHEGLAVRPYLFAMGPGFPLVNGNNQLCMAGDIDAVDRTSYPPHLNPIIHLWHVVCHYYKLRATGHGNPKGSNPKHVFTLRIETCETYNIPQKMKINAKILSFPFTWCWIK